MCWLNPSYTEARTSPNLPQEQQIYFSAVNVPTGTFPTEKKDFLSLLIKPDECVIPI